MELEVEAYIRRRYEGEISDIEIIEKEDLDLVCHLLCMLNLIFCLTSIM
jgi:DNA polymerase epsilon subunit 1